MMCDGGRGSDNRVRGRKRKIPEVELVGRYDME